MDQRFPDDLSQEDLLSFLKQSTELAADEVFWMKSDSSIFYVNNTACEKLGYSRQELIGMRVWQWDPLVKEDNWKNFWLELKQKRQLDFETQHQKKNGEIFPVRIKAHFFKHHEQEVMFAYVSDISDSKVKERQLEQQSAQMKALIEDKTALLEQEKKKFEEFVNLAPVGIAINRLEDGGFDYINSEFSRFTGYSVDELNEMDYWELTPKKYEQQELKQLNDMAEKGRYGPYQKEYIHKDGHTYPVLLSGVKITDLDGKDFIWSVVQDISQQKQFEQQIQRAKEEADSIALRMQLANDSAGIGVWELDTINNTLVWDDWMYKLYGVSKALFSGGYDAWENCIHPDDLENAKVQFESAMAGEGTFEPEFRIIRPDGEIRTMKAGAEILRNEKGEPIKVIGVNYDITDKVEAINRLALAKKEAEDANKAKSDFLANMSHEIRTPMNAILGGLQLLKNVKLDKDLSTTVENASYSAKTLLTIINDILDYSKIEQNKLDLEQEPFSMLEVINSVKFDLETLVSNKGIEFHTVVATNFVDGWVGDLVRVKQILLNLASNAVKFTEKGHVTINVSGTDYQQQPAIYIQVTDTGIGMDESVQQRVFERFSQADSSTTRKFGGTGLGMSITLSLIKMMGGTLELKSKLAEGTHISVTLPLKQANESISNNKNRSLTIPNLASKTILIAEDNKINQVLIQSILKPTKANLTLVENGRLALDAIQTQRYDLILMDIHMPEMDGLEAQQKISEIAPNIPIIALTANVMVDDVRNYLAQGFVAHVSKPIDMHNLYGVLSRYVDHQ